MSPHIAILLTAYVPISQRTPHVHTNAPFKSTVKSRFNECPQFLKSRLCIKARIFYVKEGLKVLKSIFENTDEGLLFVTCMWPYIHKCMW